jgi:hypothetical protein
MLSQRFVDNKWLALASGWREVNFEDVQTALSGSNLNERVNQRSYGCESALVEVQQSKKTTLL